MKRTEEVLGVVVLNQSGRFQNFVATYSSAFRVLDPTLWAYERVLNFAPSAIARLVARGERPTNFAEAVARFNIQSRLVGNDHCRSHDH